MRDYQDIKTIKQQAEILNVVERHVHLKKQGSEWYGICPFHDDHKNSLQVAPRKQIFKCFACGAGGDALDFLQKLGYTLKEAMNEVSGNYNESISGTRYVGEVAPRAKPLVWNQVTPAPEPANISHYRHGTPSRSWAYKAADGSLLGYICRFDLQDGAKEVLPYIYATDGSRHDWRWQGFDKPRPMYNLDRIAANPNATVLIVEGEKTADAAQTLLPHVVVTAWQGGAKAIKSTDWTPLQGRKLVLWPDNDQPGEQAMWDIADIVRPTAALLKWIPNPAEAPKHWDVADADWTPEQAADYARANIMDVPERKQPEPEPIPAPEPAPEPETVQAPEPPPAPVENEQEVWEPISDLPPAEEYHDDPDTFRFLGYTKDGENIKHHFYGNASQTIISLMPSSLSINNLIQLAPLNYWEMHFQGAKGLSMTAAANWIINTSMARGFFDDENVRGRGAWSDGKDVTIHAGDHLIINGRVTNLAKQKGRYVYQSGRPLHLNVDNPLTTAEANRIMEIARLMNWERDISAYLLVGWCIIAPMCGALKWRPHIWLTGAAGTGKSWVFQKIVRRLMEGMSLAVQSETSEAGLRQQLGHDALPVVFDEAEGEDRRAQERMQSVLGLMRAASSDDGGVITKGSAGGSAVSYKIRSCFAFASISVQVAQQSDRTRVTVLGLTKPDSSASAERWKELQLKYVEIITDEFVQRLQARTIILMPTILANTKKFAAAAAIVIGEQRAGDQLGALLAGAYSVFSNREITAEEAIEWLRERDWSEEKALDRTRDEVSLLAYLMEQMTTVETVHSRYERNLGELVAIAANHNTSDVILPEMAQARLKRIGFKIDGHYLVVSNTADYIKKVLSNTPWAKNHNKILMRLDGAINMDTTRFGSGIQTRAVGLPLFSIIEGFGAQQPIEFPQDDDRPFQ
jgi:putative DNA primase/helicase